MQSGYAVGYAISVALLPVIASLFPEELGWRVFFAIGIVPAGLVFLIRRLVPESGVFAEAPAERTRSGDGGTPFWEIFAPAHLRRTLSAVVIATGILGGVYVMITWLPTYLRTTLQLSVATSAGYLVPNILGFLAGPLLHGALANRIGRRLAFMLFLVLQACNVAVHLLPPIWVGTTIPLSFFLGAFQGGLASGMLPTFAELFPTSIRASGQAFCLGRGFGSVVPATVGLLATGMPLGTAMGGTGRRSGHPHQGRIRSSPAATMASEASGGAR